MNKRIITTLLFFIGFISSLTIQANNSEIQNYNTIVSSDLAQPTLYAPWRDRYSSSVSKKEKSSAPRTEKNCPFCLEINGGDDEKYLILQRGDHCLVMLNPFPYAKGHLLIVPYEHRENLDEYSSFVRTEIMEMTNRAFSILKEKYNFPGANIGFNIGRCAGASIPEHLHLQVVPRRYHEVSFIYTIGKTSVAGVDLRRMYQELKPLFDAD